MTKRTDDSSSPSANVRREVSYVLIAGSLGGFASWLYGIVMNDPVPGGVWGFFIAIILGAFASGIAVYVLTNTDTRAFARTLFFAALCGFAWKPVCDAGKAFIEQTVQQHQDESVQQLGDEVVDLTSGLTNLSDAQLQLKLEQISGAAQSAVQALPNVNSPKVRRDVQAKVNAALADVQSVAPRQPETASRILQSIGETAAQNQQTSIAVRSMDVLDNLAQTHSASRQVYTDARLQLETNAIQRVARPFMLRPRRPLPPR